MLLRTDLSDFALGLTGALLRALRGDYVGPECRDLSGTSPAIFLEGGLLRTTAVFLAKGPLEESVDQEITRQNTNSKEYVERHDKTDDALQDVGKS